MRHYFQFRGSEDLIELSILSGNDFTSHFLHGGFKKKIGLGGRVRISDLATWVRRTRKVENNDAFSQEMVWHYISFLHYLT